MRRDAHLSVCWALPAWSLSQELWRFHHDLPNADETFLTSDFYCFWQKQPRTTQGKNWLWSKQTELQGENLNLEYIKLTAPGQSSAVSRADTRRRQEPCNNHGHSESPCTWLQAITDIIPKQGIFLRLFSWYLAVWMLIPLTKLSLMLFPPSFPLISFSQWRKKKNTSQPSLAAPGFALILPLSFMLPTGISIWL